MFKIIKKESYRFWHVDFQDFVKEEYGFEYEAAEEYDFPHNGAYFEFTVDGDSELDSTDDDKILDAWLNEGQTKGIQVCDPDDDWQYTGSVGANHILHRLFKEGKIPPGDYMMEYYW